MLLALQIWLGIILGTLAIGLIGGVVSSRRQEGSPVSIGHLFNPVHWIHHHRKAA